MGRRPGPFYRDMSQTHTAYAPVQFRVLAADLQRHRWSVELRIARPRAQQQVSLPVWIPGSYLVREFARHLGPLQAQQGDRVCRVEQLDKTHWCIHAQPGRALVLRYEVYAFDNSVRAAWLCSQRGFFNGTSLLLRVHGLEHRPQRLHLPRPKAVEARHWELATALTPQRVDVRGFGQYQADNYDELVDHPVEMGAFWSGSFTLRGVPHRFVVAGAPARFDGARLLRDTERICQAAIDLWHPDPSEAPPHSHYVFMLNAVADDYGGLEHRASTALICRRADLPRLGTAPDAAPDEGYTNLLGLISHEYFHTWNVKRLRPAEFARYDYTRENHTELLWFFEGFTSYYDDLLVHRASLIDEAAYLRLLMRNINQVQQAPGRRVQSVAQASFDAWTRYYRPDENTPNSTISYYSKGALVALCLDLTLRREGRPTLDALMRALWQACAGGPMSEADFAHTLAGLAGRSFADEIAQWVHGTGELPLQELLQAQGVDVRHEPAPLQQGLGLRVDEARGLRIKMVLDDGPAAQAGLAAGDEWLGIELPDQAWRIQRLDELLLHLQPGQDFHALVARDARLLRLPMRLPPSDASTTWQLRPGTATDTPRWPAA